MFIFRRNSKYYVEYFDEKERRKKRISTKCTKKNDALAFIAKLEKKLKENEVVKYITLKQFEKKYTEYSKKAMSSGYNKNIAYSFGILKQHFGADALIDQLRSVDLESFFLSRYIKAKYAAALAYRTLKSAFNKCVEWNYLQANPLLKIKLPKIPQNKPLFIDDLQFKLILKKVESDVLRDLYTFAFYSGCRINEILNLKWNSIDFSSKIVHIKNSESFTTKNKLERHIPMNSILLSCLQSRIPKIQNINTNEYVFTNSKGKQFRSDTVSKWFKGVVIDAAKESLLDKSIHFHTLRHSFASLLVQKGVSLYEVSKLLGHADIRTTQIYAHLRSDDLRSAVEKLG